MNMSLLCARVELWLFSLLTTQGTDAAEEEHEVRDGNVFEHFVQTCVCLGGAQRLQEGLPCPPLLRGREVADRLCPVSSDAQLES